MEEAEGIFAKHASLTLGAANAETNAGICTVTRMLTEASDINDWLMYVHAVQTTCTPWNGATLTQPFTH